MKLACVVAMTAGLSASAFGQLYGVAEFTNFGTMGLYSIDASTGDATLIGSTGLRQIVDIAYDRRIGVMYALTSGSDLYTLDLATGAATLIGAVNTVTSEGGLTFGVSGLLASNADQLVSVSTLNGAQSMIGAISGPDNDISGLAFDAAGGLFGYAKNGDLNDSLVRIDAATGAASTVATFDFSSFWSVGGLAFDANAGEMYLHTGDILYSVDAASGALTLRGRDSTTVGFSGIAFIPSPGASLVAVAGVLLAGRRRR